MHDMTVANLRSAFGGESMAHMRYKIWSDKAASDGYPNVARLFSAVSRAEQAHATGHFRAMRDEAGPFSVLAGAGFGLGSTSDNLAGAIEGEEFEINEMYPAYLAVAELQEEKEAIRSMKYAIAAEQIHADMYKQAKQAVDDGNDYEIGDIQICPICGHTLEGGRPDTCPVCGAKGEKYITFAA
ncbi:MAG: rubrerythrin family protein [Phycisphaerae bacterium]